jgi:hypothetical protein
MTVPREAEEMTTPAQMSWDHHIVAEDDQAMPAAPVADPASAPADQTAWGPRIVAPADDDQALPEPPISDPVSAAQEASPEPAALAPSQLPGGPELGSAAAEPGTATGTDAEESRAAPAPAVEPGPASPSAVGGEGIDVDVRWHEILAMFVDDPRSSVEHAAAFAGDRAEAFVLSIKEQQDSLLSRWQRQDAETEELRVALQQYRIFCNRLEDLSRSD